MTDVIEVSRRENTGTAATRRLRRDGMVPAVLYGHGESNEHLAVPSKQVKALLRHHSKTIDLRGAVNETALINEMQWDALGIEVLHLDLIRVNLQEKVQVTVSVHLHGEAKGTHEGGILLEVTHEVDITCPAGSIPDNVGLNVTDLGVGEQATASQLELPDGCELVTGGDVVVARVDGRTQAAEEGDAEEASEES